MTSAHIIEKSDSSPRLTHYAKLGEMYHAPRFQA